MSMRPNRNRYGRPRRQRRGAVVVQVAVAMTTLAGFAALAVDVGLLYRARTELQRTADACALAAAAELTDYTNGDPLQNARLVAADYADLNKVFDQGIYLSLDDVVFGYATQDEVTGKYTFTPTESFPNAVRVIARRTASSQNGPVSLIFANVFGISQSDVAAQATAVLTPRDIALALDTSTSLNDDSSLRSFKNVEIANRNVWETLWDDTLAVQQTGATGMPEGPHLGNMDAWGEDVTNPSWDFLNDDGLVYLPRNSDWSLSTAWASQTLQGMGYGQYTTAEIDAINSDAYDSSSTTYEYRVLVALGVYRWKSGKSGGQSGGDGDNKIESGELQLMVSYPSASSNPSTYHKQVGGGWDDFVDYVESSSSSMCQYSPSSQLYGDPALRYRYGLKTWVDYLQEKKYGETTSPGFAGSPQQPIGAILDAVQTSVDIIDDLESDDLVGLSAYATVGYGPDDKPDHMSWLTDDLNLIRARVNMLQPGMWTTNTNVAQGIDEAINVLQNSDDARPNAAKTILLLTDGIANQVRQSPTYWDEDEAAADAKDAAQDARDLGMRIYTVSVGANADQDLMEDIAAIGGGEHYHAEGDIATYTAQLQEIFQKLGGKRPVVLIE